MLILSNGTTLTDTDLWNLKQALAAATAPATTPPTTPVVTPPGVRVIQLPWAKTPGSPGPNITIGVGEVLAFAFTPPLGFSSNGVLGNFSFSPTNQNAYSDRYLCLSDTPGDFSQKLAPEALKIGQEPNVYFSVDGYPVRQSPRGGYTYVDKTSANLTPGVTYYANVKQVDRNVTATINYGLSPP